ncbi:hypothetical protein AC578_4067 [Pseudocercospora eumusae]|uniref:Uncharacterized protein n=1 Tax=Pseudocercospora eumusae TaxID=321146 RepID=A0A139HDI8_9PEZI|nr:hypothetical protein AC578_4067 [Pseudocercospora eumusae]
MFCTENSSASKLIVHGIPPSSLPSAVTTSPEHRLSFTNTEAFIGHTFSQKIVRTQVATHLLLLLLLLLPRHTYLRSLNSKNTHHPKALVAKLPTMSAFKMLAPTRALITRSFTSVRAVRAAKETKPADEGRAEEIERVKLQQLREQKEGKNSWKEDIASDSESVVKADRGEIHNARDTISQLQEESAKAAQREKDGK